MISVNMHKCIRCGNEAVAYKEPCLGETLNRCDNCGWESTRIPRESNHGFILDENYEMTFDRLENEGFGVLNLVYKNNAPETYSFKEILKEVDIEKFMNKLKTDNDLLLEECFFTVWNDNENRLEVLFGKLPMPYCDEISIV